MKVKGSCLCKGVKYIANIKSKGFNACHCSMCTKWSSSPYMAIETGGDIEFTGLEKIKKFSSSEWAERGFCRECGTHLFYRLKNPDMNFCNVSFGTVDDRSSFEFKNQFYIDKKPQCYSFSNMTNSLTEKEILDFFAHG